MANWLDNSDIQGRVPELETPPSLASDAAARLREAHARPARSGKQDMIQQLLKPQSGGSSGGGLLDGIL